MGTWAACHSHDTDSRVSALMDMLVVASWFVLVRCRGTRDVHRVVRPFVDITTIFCTRLILVGDCTFYVYIKPIPVRFSAKVLFCSVLEDSDRTRPRTSSKVASWPMLRYTFTACVTRVIVFVRY
jgi:hypothetical protein